MKQHPIPQNILDVEFKLFTRFTVKEFAYIATGIVIGALFIYLWTEERIPGIVAFPSFAMFAGTGLVLGLVPIQDQPADKILANYLKAINRPTLRVWHGEEMKLRLKDRENAAKEAVVQVQKPSNSQSNLVDAEEDQKLREIGKMMEETGLATEGTSQNIPQKTTSSVTITKENIRQFMLPNIKVQLSGTINLLILNKQNQAINNATVIIKDNAGKTKLAAKSGTKGEVLTNQKLGNGEYKIEIQHEKYSFGDIKFMVEHPVYPIIKITSL
jgi:hypothetical protein